MVTAMATAMVTAMATEEENKIPSLKKHLTRIRLCGF